MADAWGGRDGEYRLYLHDNTLNGVLWNKGEYSAQFSVPFTDTTQWHRLKMTWKEGEETRFTLDDMTVSVTNGSPLAPFSSGSGMHVLGAYPSGGSGSFFFHGMTRNVTLRNYYDPASAIPGDLNGDGVVGGGDLDILRANWGRSVPPGDFARGDASGDGLVGSDDLDLIRANWGCNAPAPIPEPEAVALFAIGFLRAGLVRTARTVRLENHRRNHSVAIFH